MTDAPLPRRSQAKGSLVRRLILLAAGWSLLVLLLTGLALTAFFRQSSYRTFDLGLSDLVDAVYSGVTVAPGGRLIPPTLSDVRTTRVYSGRYWQIAQTTPRGGLRTLERSRSLFDSELRAPEDIVARLNADPGTTVFYDWRGPDGEPIRIAALQSRLPGRAEPLVVMAAQNSGPVAAEARRFAVLTAAALAALAVGLVSAVFVQVRIGLRPIFQMGREIARVRMGKAQRLTRAYPHELAPLANELNALLDHNQEVVERQRTHVGNLAHALKTPISVMLAESEGDQTHLAEVVGRQAQAMREHVDHHLRRARAAARSTTQGERTPVEPLLDELAVTLERIFQSKPVQIDWRCPDDLAFAGERQDLMEVGRQRDGECVQVVEGARARRRRAGRRSAAEADGGGRRPRPATRAPG
jgi:signal transduction histidine kinase